MSKISEAGLSYKLIKVLWLGILQQVYPPHNDFTILLKVLWLGILQQVYPPHYEFTLVDPGHENFTQVYPPQIMISSS